MGYIKNDAMLVEKLFIAESCPNCGGDIKIVKTMCLAQNYTEFKQVFCDCDEAVCGSICGFYSCVSADENGAWIQDGNIDDL
jgi:hypothetical protein